jgi:catechol 2,3-dioxygenase-like lactoylglutathione lyase family enzyme
MLKHGLLLLSALLATTGVVELARSDNDSLVLRRQTLIVRDIDTSLALYRDAIGMTVIYDQVIRRPHKTEDRTQEIRLVFLKATDDYIGVLGLVDYEYNNPDHPAHHKPVRHEGFTPGNAVVLFNTTRLNELWPGVASAPGVEVINGPAYTEYPSYDGAGVIRVNVSRFYDADGFLVELNQPIDTIKPGG